MSSSNGGGGGGGAPPQRNVLNIPAVYSPTASTREQYFPEIVDDDWDPVVNAPGFKNTKERAVFNARYDSVAQQYYQDVLDTATDGQGVLQMFKRWKPVVRNFVLTSMRSDSVDNKLGATLSSSPNGGQQATMRAIREDTITNASYEQEIDSEGQFNIFPGEGAGDNTVTTPTANEQAWIIFGFIEYNAGGVAPYDYIQSELEDSRGVYEPTYVRHQVASADTMAVIELTDGPRMAYPGIGIDMDVNATKTGITTGLWPVGHEVIVANSSAYGGVLD